MNNPSVIMDSNEAAMQPSIAEYLKRYCGVTIKNLSRGDYAFGSGFAVERKTVLNLFNDISTRHLWDQLPGFVEIYEKPIMLIENFGCGLDNSSEKRVMGVIFSLLNPEGFGKKLKLLFSTNKKETKRWLRALANYGGPTGNKPLPSFVKNEINPYDIRKYMVCCVSGIGKGGSHKIWGKYANFDELVGAPKESLMKVVGRKSGLRLYRALHSKRRKKEVK